MILSLFVKCLVKPRYISLLGLFLVLHPPSVRAQLRIPLTGSQQIEQLGDFPLVTNDRIWNMVFSADGKELITVSDLVTRHHLGHPNKQQILWEPNEGDSMSHAVFSKDRKFFARFGNGDKIHIHDAVNGKSLSTLSNREGYTLAGAWGPKGKLFAAGGIGEILLWNVETGELVKRIPHQKSAVVTLGISPDGKRIAAGNRDEKGVQGLLFIHAIDGDSKPVRLEEGTGWSSRMPLVFSPDGKTISGPSELKGRSKFCVWDATTGKALHRYQGLGYNYGVYSPDGKWVAACGLNNIQVWDVKTGEEVFRHQEESINEHVWSLAISPDGNLLAAGIENRVRIWDTRTWKVTNPSKNHQTPVSSVVFSTDGNFLVSGSWKGRVILWDWKTKSQVWANDELSHMSFREVEQDAGPSQNYSWGVEDLSLSPDGNLIVVNAHRGCWKDRRISGMKTYHVINRHTGQITKSMWSGGYAWGNILISKDSQTAFTGSGEGSIFAWDLKTGTMIRRIGTQPAGKGGEGITFLAFDGDPEERIWWSGEHHRLGMRQLSDGKDVRILKGGSGTHDSKIQISPNRDWVMAGRTLWSLPKGELVAPYRRNESIQKRVLAHPSGLISVGASGGKAVLIDMLTYKPMHEVEFGPGEILSMTFSPDGKSLLAAGEFGIKYLDFAQPAQFAGLEKALPEKLWQLMGGEDAWLAYQAAWALSHKEDWMPFLESKVPLADEPSLSEISRLKATMQDGNAEVATAAARLLLDTGVELSKDEIESLRRPDANAHPSNIRFRFTGQIPIPGVDYQPGPVPELLPLSQRMRNSRAVMLLEEDGSNEAVAILTHLAGGYVGSPITKEAAFAISRLKSR